MALSVQMSELLREELYAANSDDLTPELKALQPIFARQRKESIVPKADEFLIETFKTREGYHAVFYPLRYGLPQPAGGIGLRLKKLTNCILSLCYPCRTYKY